jgi:hypothetical protein
MNNIKTNQTKISEISEVINKVDNTYIETGSQIHHINLRHIGIEHDFYYDYITEDKYFDDHDFGIEPHMHPSKTQNIVDKHNRALYIEQMDPFYERYEYIYPQDLHNPHYKLKTPNELILQYQIENKNRHKITIYQKHSLIDHQQIHYESIIKILTVINWYLTKTPHITIIKNDIRHDHSKTRTPLYLYIEFNSNTIHRTQIRYIMKKLENTKVTNRKINTRYDY